VTRYHSESESAGPPAGAVLRSESLGRDHDPSPGIGHVVASSHVVVARLRLGLAVTVFRGIRDWHFIISDSELEATGAEPSCGVEKCGDQFELLGAEAVVSIRVGPGPAQAGMSRPGP
jgi:hypothetical protein